MKPKFALGLLLLGAAPFAPMLTMGAHARPANVPVHTPKPGSRERAAIMDALRVPITKESGGKRVTFTYVDEFRVGGGWACLGCVPVDAKGKPIGPPDLTYLSALLHFEKGKWRVKETVYAGDVVQIEWAKRYPNVPLNVLGLKPSDLR